MFDIAFKSISAWPIITLIDKSNHFSLIYKSKHSNNFLRTIKNNISLCYLTNNQYFTNIRNRKVKVFTV